MIIMSDTAAFLIQILKEQCLRQGFGGIRGLGVVFRCMDLDWSRALVYEELKIGLERFGLRMPDNYLKTLFDTMDKDKNGEIDFLEFMKALRDPLNRKRIDVINEAFDKLDTNSDGVIDVDDLKEMAARGQELIEEMRGSCLVKGCGGIKLLSVIFRHMDKDYSKRLTRKEFKQGVVRFGISELSEKDLELLFQYFDRDDNDTIDFDEFFRRLRPPLKKSRESTVNEAFDRVDVNKDGVIKVDDLKVFYTTNAKNHPKYISGEWTLEETLRSFLDSIDSPDDPDGVVTREEFLDYYAGVSATIDDDSYFVMMMRSCYGLPQR